MTEDQVKKWQQRRTAAKQIADPVAREAALDLVYDLKDDMQLDCQRKMADRIKELVSSDLEQHESIAEVKRDLASLKRSMETHEVEFENDHATVQEIRDNKLKVAGAWSLLRVLGYILAVGGGSLITWLLTIVNKAGGVQ